MNLKRASTLVILFEPQGIVVRNFLTKDTFNCTIQCLDFLNSLTNWQSLETIYSRLKKQFPHTTIESILSHLIESNAIISKHSELARRDDNYNDHWQWGAIAGFYHFSIRNTRFLEGNQQRAAIRQRRKELEEPNAATNNLAYKNLTQLPEFNSNNELFNIMRKRRSQRNYKDEVIPLHMLADCLYAANGIEKWLNDADFGRLPLTMTPSGGARNPYELYVYARAISDLDAGFYHYSAEQHSLGLVSNQTLNMKTLFAGQEWTSIAAAAIFLVANFNRSSWKYHLAPAYRIVLMEAGFIGQNITLAATKHGLSAVPTGAVNEDLIEHYLKTSPVKEAHILSLIIGKPISD